MRRILLTTAVPALAFAAYAIPSRLAPASEAHRSVPKTTATAARLIRRAVAADRTEPSVCPQGMLLVEGKYCPKVRHTCKRYLDSPGRYGEFRCAEYARPSCESRTRVPIRVCMDRDEYTSQGQRVPDNFRSFSNAERLCGQQGKRVCRESEWNFACEGEEMRPYPYGFKRDAGACNADHVALIGTDGKLRDMRAPSDAHPRCDSPFGIRNMAGNLEEFVAIDGSRPVRPAMKGAYWQPSRNFCRAAQTAHDRYYNGVETGFRCCADAPPRRQEAAQES